MILNWEIGVVALILWIIYEWFGLSWYPAAVVAGIWVVGTLLVTAGFAMLSGEAKVKQSNDLPNVNPYSMTNEDIMKYTPQGKAKKEDKSAL